MKKNTVRILALVLVALMCLSLIPLAAHAEGHVHFYEPTTIAPTCAQNGYVQMICEACGDGGEILSWIPPTGEHSFIPVEDEEYLIEEGDCTHPYQYWKSCSVCKQSAEEAYGLAIDKLVEELNARKQSGEQADWETVAKDRVLLLDERYKFSAGGEGHHIVHVDHQEATCLSDGWKDYTYCDVCNEYFNYEAIPAKGHRWTEFKVTKAATCTEPGSQERVCEVCDEKEVQVIPALGHKGEFVMTKEPTCYSTGAKQHTCTVCGETAVEWIDMAHKYENGVCVFCGAAQPADEKSVSETAAFQSEEAVEEPVEEIAALDNIIYISFDGNGATSGSMEAQAFEPGTTQNLSPNAFERTGYRFVGWDYMADGSGWGEKPLYDGAEVKLSDNMTLYAQWAEDPEAAAENAVEETTEFEAIDAITIIFDKNDGDGDDMESLTIKAGTNASLIKNTYTRTLYAFSGWNTKPDKGGKHFADEESVSVDDFANFNSPVTLYAEWDRIIVTFDPNGGQGTAFEQLINESSESLAKNIFTRPGYTYTGWDTDSGGQGKHFYDEEKVSTDIITAPTRLYAQWKKDISITYQSNGSTEDYYAEPTQHPGSKIKIKTQEETGIKDKPNREFIKWNTAPDGSGTAYEPGDFLTLTESTNSTITLYAQWGFEVAFDSNDGEGDMETDKAIENQDYQIPPSEFTKADNDFLGWSTTISGEGGKAYDNEAIIPGSDMVNPFTLYAQWDKIYTVTFNANGGKNPKDNTTVTIQRIKQSEFDAAGEKGVTLNENPFTYTKDDTVYEFIGWSTTASGKEPFPYGDKDSVETNAFSEQKLTLFAQWKEAETDSAKITFDSNGGKGTMNKQTVTKNTPTELFANSFSREGYSFNGWNTEANGSGTSYANSAKISISANTTLYALWTPNDGITTINEECSDEAVETSFINFLSTKLDSEVGQDDFVLRDVKPVHVNDKTPLSKEEILEVGGVTFAIDLPDHFDTANPVQVFHYDGTDWEPVANIEVKGQQVWVKNYKDFSPFGVLLDAPITVTFNSNGGTGTMAPQSITHSEEPLKENTFTKDGYAFVGWNTAVDGTGSAYKDKDTSVPKTADITLYAQWSKKITVKFFANSGTGVMSDQVIIAGEWTELNANEFKKEDNVFNNWTTAPNGTGTKYTDKQKVRFSDTDDAVISLYAQWTPQAVVTFDGNGATSGTMEKQVGADGAAMTLKANEFERTGYAFAGWQEYDSGSSEYNDGATIPANKMHGTIKLRAKWEELYTVTFNNTIAGETADPQEIKKSEFGKDGVALDKNAFEREDYVFTGWHDSNMKHYDDEQKVKPEDFDSNRKLELYADWEIEVTITFVPNGGSGTMTPQSVPKNKDAELKANTFSRSAYFFNGWQDEEGTVTYENKGTIPAEKITEDFSLYAQWNGPLEINGSTSLKTSYAYIGETLTVSIPDETDVEYNWCYKKSSSDTNWTKISGATGKTYVLSFNDVEVGRAILACAAIKDGKTIISNSKTVTEISKLMDFVNYGTSVTNVPTQSGQITGVSDGLEYSTDYGVTWHAVTATDGIMAVPNPGVYVFRVKGRTEISDPIDVYNWWSIGYSLSTGSSSDSGGSGSVTFKRGSTTLSSSTRITVDGETVLQPYSYSGYTNVWLVRADAGITDITMNVKPSSGSYGHVALNNGSYSSSSAERTIQVEARPAMYQVVFNKSSSSPRTADMSHLGLWSALCLTSFVGAATILGSARKRKKDQA